jgi:hypothetical protein
MTATREQIVHHFLHINPTDITRYNWGCTDHHNTKLWDVTNTTYINGIPLIVDHDLDHGYLLEIVERDTKAISYLIITTTPHGHDSDWWDGNAGTFFQRTTTRDKIALWATQTIHNHLTRDET